MAALTALVVLGAGAVPAAAAPAGGQAQRQGERGLAASRPAVAVKPGPLPGGGYVGVGSASRLVRLVQRRVSRSGFRVRVDGVFGSRTEAAVRRFQSSRGLLVDGVVGRQTMTALRGRAADTGPAAEDGQQRPEGGEQRLESTRPGRRRGAARDRDRDGLPDRWERRHRLPTTKKSAGRDNDRDGLRNRAEWRRDLDPRRRDTDRDGLGDGAEVQRHRTDPRRRDTDGDGISDGDELRRGTNPRRRDRPRPASPGSIAAPPAAGSTPPPPHAPGAPAPKPPATEPPRPEPPAAPDTTGPQLTLTAPAAGVTLTAAAEWAADASDPGGIDRVELLVDGAVKDTDTTAPYGGSWNPAGTTTGAHTLAVKAFDTAGNSSVKSISVTVDLGGGGGDAFDYSATWFGNSFSGANGRWVPHGAQAIAVTPDGSVYSALIWEEGARELRGYKDGRVFGPNPGLHGGGNQGGMAVAADAGHVYTAAITANRFGVRRYARSVFDAGADGYYPGQTMDIPQARDGILGLALHGGELFVAYPEAALGGSDRRQAGAVTVNVYDAAAFSGAVKRSFSVPRARQLAFDGSGQLWALQQRDGSTAPVVSRYDRQGAPQPQKIAGVDDPVAIAIDPRGAGLRMLVADNGPDQNIKIFTDIGTTPVADGTFGVEGGYLAGPRKGETGPQRFDGPRGVGVDAQGNVYVASNGTAGVGERVFAYPEYGRHLVLESYRPDGSRNWDLQGLEFIDRGSIDPGSETDIYTRDEHFEMDYSRPLGQQWVYKGRTLDPFTYPNDKRIQRGGNVNASETTWVRRFEGRRFLLMTSQNGGHLSLFRLRDSDEIAVPAGFFVPQWTQNEYIWGDRNGNGQDDGGSERSSRTTMAPPANGWWPDARGDIWQATRDRGIRRFRLERLDAHDNPVYSFDAMDTHPMPAPFTDLRRIQYDPASDTMYLTGYRNGTDNASYGAWKSSGRTIARYDDWLAGNRTARWVKDLPYSELSTIDGLNKPVSISVAGDYVFVGWTVNLPTNNYPFIKVYKAGDGTEVGTIDRNTEVGGQIGWFDAFHSIEAHERSNGEYLIVAEEGGYAKNLIYRFCPRASCG